MEHPTAHRLAWHLPYWCIIAGLGFAYLQKRPAEKPGYFADLHFSCEKSIDQIQASNSTLSQEIERGLDAYPNETLEQWRSKWQSANASIRRLNGCLDQAGIGPESAEATPQGHTQIFDPALATRWNNNWNPVELQARFSAANDSLQKFADGYPEVQQALRRLLTIDPDFWVPGRWATAERELYAGHLKLRCELVSWMVHSFIYNQVACDGCIYSNQMLWVIPPAGRIRAGQPVTVRLLLACDGTKYQNIAFSVDGKPLPGCFNGAEYTVFSPVPGKKSMIFRADLKNPFTGEVQTWARQFEFEVE